MNNSIKNGIKIFILLTIGISIIILLLTVSHKTWEYLKKVKFIYFLITLIFLFVYYYLDGLRVKVLTKALGYNISVFTGIEIVVSGIFLAAVTPFQTGGFPVQAYYLKKNGISYGEGTLILFMRGVLAVIFHIVVLPFIFLSYIYFFENNIIKIVLKYVIIIYPLIFVLFIILFFLPDKMIALLNILERKLFSRNGKSKNFLKKITVFLEREIKYFKDGFKIYLKKRKLILSYALFLTFISYIFFFSIAILLLEGLGVKVMHPLMIANLQFLHNFLVYFMPTPGASGIAETLFAILFKDVCPKDILGIYAIIWRFFTFTIGAFIGGIFTLKIVQKSGKNIDQILNEAPRENNIGL